MADHSVEFLAAQAAISVANLPFSELGAAQEAHHTAHRQLEVTMDDSPELVDLTARLEEAGRRLATLIGALSVGHQEIVTYTAAIGYKNDAIHTAIPSLEAWTAQPGTLDEAERERRLQRCEELLSIGTHADKPGRTYHRAIIGDIAKKESTTTLREALRTPGQRMRALEVIETLVGFECSFSGEVRDYYRQTGAFACDSVSEELLALATQKDDQVLARRVCDLIVNSFSQPLRARSIALAQYVVTHLPSYIYTSVYRLQQQRKIEGPAGRYATARDRQREKTEGARLGQTIASALAHGDRQQRTRITDQLKTLNRHDATHEFSLQVLQTMYQSFAGRVSILDTLGLNAPALEHAWDIGYGQVLASDPDPDTVRANNMHTVFTLERDKRGSAVALQRLLNLHNFERLPLAVLQDAYEALHDPPDSYILYAVATWSYNSAFRNKYNHLASMHAVAKRHNTAIIPVEFSSEEDIRRVRRTLRQAGWGPAEHAIINIHGASSQVMAGLTVRRESVNIHTDALRRPGLRGLGRLVSSIIKPGGTLHLISCSTAEDQRNGFGLRLSESAGRTTSAPDRVVYTSRVELVPDRRTGKLEPVVSYGDLATQRPVEPVIFVPRPGSL